MSTTARALSHRDLALLRATAAGRCELICGCQPDLLIEGRWCCDQTAAHQLAAAGLLGPGVSAPTGASARRAHRYRPCRAARRLNRTERALKSAIDRLEYGAPVETTRPSEAYSSTTMPVLMS